MFGYLNAADLAGRYKEKFLESVGEAIAWADAYADISDPKKSLRRLEEDAWWGHLSTRSDRVGQLISARHRKLEQAEGVSGIVPLERAREGRFLVYLPDLELFDGVAEAETSGFFDVHNTPPHDTWIAMVAGEENRRDDDFLLSWVPPPFVDLVNDGIEVNPEECILWLEDLDHPIVPVVREFGLIQ